MGIPYAVSDHGDYTRRMSVTASTSDLAEQEAGPQTSPGSNRLKFVWTVGFAFAIVALQLGQGILLARLLGPEGRGAYATAILYVQMLLYIGLLGGLEVICRHAADRSIDQLRLRRAALWLGLTTGTITTLIVVGLNLVALPEAKRSLLPIALVCSLSLIGQHVMLIMTAVDRGSGEFGKYNLRRFVAAAAFPALLLGAVVITEMTVTLAAWLFVAASIISMATCILGVAKPLTGTTAIPTKQLLRESRPYGFSMFVTDLFERLDLLLVLWLAPLVEQGFYAAMVPAAYPLTVIPNTLGLFLFNAGADKDRKLSRGDVHRILGSSIAIQTLTTVVFMLLIGPLVVLVYGQEFEPAIQFVLWLAPASAIKGILQGLDSYLKGRGRPLAPIKARGCAMLVMFITALVLVPSQGTVAIAMAALAGQVVCLIWLSAIVYADVSATRANLDQTP